MGNLYIVNIFKATILGVLTGSLTGLTPGVHVNTAIALISTQSKCFSILAFISFIVSASVAHTFLDIIPTLFLGIPDESLAVAVYPAHEMVLDGKGIEAASISAASGIISAMLSIPVMFIFIYFLPAIPLRTLIVPVLVAVSLLMILTEKPNVFGGRYSVWVKRLQAFVIFVISGIVGILAFKMDNFVNITPASSSLIPLFMGLFAFPILMVGIFRESKLPNQIGKLSCPNIPATILGTISGFIVSVFPGISSGVASSIAVSPFKERDAEKYISATGASNTANAILCFAVLIAIKKFRSGAAIALKNYTYFLRANPEIIAFVCIFSALLSALLVLIFALLFSKILRFIKTSVLCLISLLFVIFIVIYLTGVFGLLLFSVSSLVGLLPAKFEVRRIHCMGCIIIPILLIYAVHIRL